MSELARYRLFMTAAAIGILGWIGLIALGLWWTFQPANLPSVKEPIPVLNYNNEVAVGEDIELLIDTTKTVALTVTDSDRYLTCEESGNLVTLTGSDPVTLPVGRTVVQPSITLPNKVAPGEVCKVNYSVVYVVNPLRSENVVYSSQEFTVVEAA